MPPLLTTHQLTKIHQPGAAATPAVRGVDLAIEAGEFVALTGPSGCGKSSLLHLLGGLDRPTSGEIHLADRRVDRLSEARWAVLRRREVGYMFQAFNLIPNLSVADNVELPALLAGYAPREARRRREALLERLGVADKASSRPALLSGGQQQRVALARAVINQPRLLLADEPTGSLDSRSTGDVLALLRALHADGQTIVLVTHAATVATAASRVLRMRDGRLLAASMAESAVAA